MHAEGIKALDPVVAERMGYPDAVAAYSTNPKKTGGTVIDVAIIPPGKAVFKGWAVVTQVDCDPDDPTAGTSGVTECVDREQAEKEALDFLGLLDAVDQTFTVLRGR